MKAEHRMKTEPVHSGSRPRILAGKLVLPPWMATLVLLVTLGCRAPRSDAGWASQRLFDGRALGELVEHLPVVAVLFYDPTYCFSCEGNLTAWREWASRRPERSVLLLLTRNPTAIERIELARQRISFAGVSRLPQVPATIIFSNGVVVDSATGLKAVRTLLAKHCLRLEPAGVANPFANSKR